MATTTKNDLSVETTEHPNVGRMRTGFAAFSRGDLEAVHATMTDDCVWTNAGSGPLKGSYQGWDAIQAMFGKLIELTGGTFSMNVLSTLADDKYAVAIYDSTSTVNGKTGTFRFVMTEEVTPDGKSAVTHSMALDQAAADKHLEG